MLNSISFLYLKYDNNKYKRLTRKKKDFPNRIRDRRDRFIPFFYLENIRLFKFLTSDNS